MKRTVETIPNSPFYPKRAALAVASTALLLSGCENTVSGIPQPKSVIEEASETGSAIPLPKGMECPTGGNLVKRVGKIVAASTFIAERYRRKGEPDEFAANSPVMHYVAQNGMDVYCGGTYRRGDVDKLNKMIVPNSCVDTGTREVGATVVGIDPLPNQPWVQRSAAKTFVGCPKLA